MATCVPIKELRDTARFAELVATSATPITVTKNGYDEFIAIRSSDYEALCQADAKARILERMIIAEKERYEGNTIDADTLLDDLKKKYDL